MSRAELKEELREELIAELKDEVRVELLEDQAYRIMSDTRFGNENHERELINHEMNSSPNDNSDHFANYRATGEY